MSTWVGAAWVSCGGGGDTAANGANSLGGGGAFSSGGGQGNHHANGGGTANGGGGGLGGGIVVPDGGGCVKPTCKGLNADCGDVTDTKCGGVIDCGMCPSGESCGLGGPNKCGKGSPDACAMQSCSDQGKNCGQIGDGCGNTISCGDCTSPKLCGGDPTKPNVCGCTGVCSQIPDCQPGMTTTLTGKVLDPIGTHPLYNALVYIPNDPNDAGLDPFAAGITCDVCGATAAGNPLVTAYTAPDGTFTLTNVPVGNNIKLVVQLGRWRRQFSINITNSCGANAVDPGTLTMPKNHTEGDIPRIALLTGGFDPIECVLRKMGITDTGQNDEFTNPSGGGRVQFYTAAAPNRPSWGYPAGTCPPNPYGAGATIDATTPGQTTLYGTTGGQPTINQYDLVVLECEGYEADQSAGDLTKLRTYAESGGRVFTSDYAYSWLFTNGNFAGTADWSANQNPSGSPETGTIDLVSNPEGTAFEQWLQNLGFASGNTVSLNPVFHNSNGVVSPTQQWLYWGASTPIHFTFNTPVGAASDQQCGRVVFSDWHADLLNFKGNYPACLNPNNSPPPYYSNGLKFPAECDTNPMTPQEAILEFMLFDLTSCVKPYQPLCTPTTCTAQGIQCGPAGDGCGNLLQCGDCPAGQFCGGGGTPGKCGMTNNCVPATCASQGIQCGAAGDGCGNELNCGNCATGQVCGLGGPGKCGMLH